MARVVRRWRRGAAPSALQQYVECVVGPCSVVSTLEKAGRGDVIEVLDRRGTRWFAKRLVRADQWEREVGAYRHWVPALGDRAPRLEAADEELRTVVLTAVPGRRGSGKDSAVHAGAGALLRTLHDAADEQPLPPGFGASMVPQLESWLVGSDGLFSARELDFARARTRELAELSLPGLVPTHGDYGPPNWIVDTDGIVRTLDFVDSCRRVWLSDLTRVGYGPWWGRADLHDSFMAGYGRSLTESDREFLRLSLAGYTVKVITWGRLHGKRSVEARGRDRLEELMRDPVGQHRTRRP